MQKIRWLLWLLGILLVVSLVVQNSESQEIDLLWMSQTLPLSVMLLVTTAVGFLLGALTTVTMLRSSKKAKKQAAAEAKTPEKN